MSTLATLTAEVKVVELLRTLDEALVAWDSGSEGGGVTLMPSLYVEGSYAELERRLREMRDSRTLRSEWWHVTGRYRAGEVRTLTVPVRKLKLGPKPVLPERAELVAGAVMSGERTARVRAYVWSGQVDALKVQSGLSTLTGLMHDGRPERIRLPKVFVCRLLGLPFEEGRKAA